MTALQGIPRKRIIAAVADAAERWSDADFPARVRVLDGIVMRTGYSLPVVEYALDRIFFSLQADALEATIATELGEAPERMVEPIGRVCIISSRTTIGVAIVPAVFALCARCDVLVKDREDGLVRAFFATLAEELDAFAVAARAQHWEGEGDAVDLASFDAVVAFGNTATLDSIQQRLAPNALFIPFGSKLSIGYVARESLGEAISATTVARGAARDLLLYDGEGCLSLRALFLEDGAALDPAAFASILAREVERAAVEFPVGVRDAAIAARVAYARDGAAFRAATGSGAVFSDATASYLLALDPPNEAPPLLLPRSLSIYSAQGPDAVLTYVRRHSLPVEAIAISHQRSDVVAMCNALGVPRIAHFGDLQDPPLGTRHGGRPRFTEFIRDGD